MTLIFNLPGAKKVALPKSDPAMEQLALEAQQLVARVSELRAGGPHRLPNAISNLRAEFGEIEPRLLQSAYEFYEPVKLLLRTLEMAAQDESPHARACLGVAEAVSEWIAQIRLRIHERKEAAARKGLAR